jgi:hypothetical protein
MTDLHVVHRCHQPPTLERHLVLDKAPRRGGERRLAKAMARAMAPEISETRISIDRTTPP